MVSISLLFLAISPQIAAASDSGVWRKPWRDVDQLVQILKTVPSGQAVLARASRKDPRFLEKIKTGQASFTESTFSRTYSLVDGHEQIHLQHEVTLNSDLRLSDAVVDLAHELVHFTEKGMLDPYRSGFELEHFIRNGIEGEGGELAALAVECRVAWSLEEQYASFPTHQLCERYRGEENTFQREAARVDYYRLGTWYRKAKPDLGAILPEISAHAPVFTSSYASKPYPVALMEEFRMTQRAACANNRRKYRLIASQSVSRGVGTAGRLPSSATLLSEEKRRLKTYDRIYCSDVIDPDNATQPTE